MNGGYSKSLNFDSAVKTYLGTLKWEILHHLLYSPVIAPSDYHLSITINDYHGLSEQRFTSYEDTKKWIDSSIASKDESFFQRGIRMLPERWKKLVASDGQYFDESTGNHFFNIAVIVQKKSLKINARSNNKLIFYVRQLVYQHRIMV